jgi:hypothetical protein
MMELKIAGQRSIGMKSESERRLYDLDAAAAYLGRAKSGVRHLIYLGELPVVQMGEKGKQYLDLRDLEDFIMKHKRRLP